MLNNFHKFGFIVLLEPFQQVRNINSYKRRLRATEVFHNTNGKIWMFISNGFNATVISNIDQQISLILNNHGLDIKFSVTIVYAKGDKELRMDLWDSLYSISCGMTTPWIVGGDFNAVLNGEEKIGGIPVTAADVEDFQTCIGSSDLSQISF